MGLMRRVGGRQLKGLGFGVCFMSLYTLAPLLLLIPLLSNVSVTEGKHDFVQGRGSVGNQIRRRCTDVKVQ